MAKFWYGIPLFLKIRKGCINNSSKILPFRDIHARVIVRGKISNILSLEVNVLGQALLR